MTELIEYIPYELQAKIYTYTPHPLSLVYLTGILQNGWWHAIVRVSCIKPSKPGICIAQVCWEDDEWWEDTNPGAHTQFEFDFWMNNKEFYRTHLKSIEWWRYVRTSTHIRHLPTPTFD